MGFARPMQKFQDWFTQQWAIATGRIINPSQESWLLGPFSEKEAIGDGFIHQLAEREGLSVNRNSKTKGLISSFHELGLSEEELTRLSKEVVSFYQKTGLYKMRVNVKWNPFFWLFGKLIAGLFSNRIRQLNVPLRTPDESNQIQSEIITLTRPDTGQVVYTVWYRTFESTGEVLYSGVYGTCTLPSGKVCVKAVFPLPNGNATVIMTPSVGLNNELVLDSSGRKYGDAGFYFLLSDSENNYRARYVRSFRDKLTVASSSETISAEQTLTLWHLRVLRFRYVIAQEEGAV